jgi:hypothetical protein
MKAAPRSEYQALILRAFYANVQGIVFKMQPNRHATCVVDAAQRIVYLVCASPVGADRDDHPLA